jgi:hypothetical protein
VYNRDASYEPEVLEIIEQAEGIFFEGNELRTSTSRILPEME